MNRNVPSAPFDLNNGNNKASLQGSTFGSSNNNVGNLNIASVGSISKISAASSISSTSSNGFKTEGIPKVKEESGSINSMGSNSNNIKNEVLSSSSLSIDTNNLISSQSTSKFTRIMLISSINIFDHGNRFV